MTTEKTGAIIVGDNSDLSVEEQKKLAKRLYQREYMVKYMKERRKNDPEFAQKQREIVKKVLQKKRQTDPEYVEKNKEECKKYYEKMKEAYKQARISVKAAKN